MVLDTNQILFDARVIAKQAGVITRELFYRSVEMSTKSSDIDLVTEADLQSEKFIVEHLRELYPDFGIVGEEGSQFLTDAPYRWIIDPVDGTTNFAHRVPHYAISIALADSNPYPALVGVVYDPMRDECFTAVRGQGAFLNGRPIGVSHTSRLGESLLASGFPYTKWTDPDNNADHWSDFVVRTRDVRRLGSASLDIAYVATGRMDGYWEHNLSAWDISAALLVLKEAGGTFRT
jgi:myo-inositol-1(or 4)-monophosphatase